MTRLLPLLILLFLTHAAFASEWETYTGTDAWASQVLTVEAKKKEYTLKIKGGRWTWQGKAFLSGEKVILQGRGTASVSAYAEHSRLVIEIKSVGVLTHWFIQVD